MSLTYAMRYDIIQKEYICVRVQGETPWILM